MLIMTWQHLYRSATCAYSTQLRTGPNIPLGHVASHFHRDLLCKQLALCGCCTKVHSTRNGPHETLLEPQQIGFATARTRHLIGVPRLTGREPPPRPAAGARSPRGSRLPRCCGPGAALYEMPRPAPGATRCPAAPALPGGHWGRCHGPAARSAGTVGYRYVCGIPAYGRSKRTP